MRQQIKSPKTKRLIYVGGNTYNKLIKEYSLDEIQKIPILNQNYITNGLTGINDTDASIIYYLEGEDLLNICQVNTRINLLCKTDKILKSKIDQYINENRIKFDQMVYFIARAINAANDKKGVSLQTIKKYLECNFKIEPTDPWINFTIYILINTEGQEKLMINPYHRGHYRLSPKLKQYMEKYET